MNDVSVQQLVVCKSGFAVVTIATKFSRNMKEGKARSFTISVFRHFYRDLRAVQN